jgi:hypothetical protein
VLDMEGIFIVGPEHLPGLVPGNSSGCHGGILAQKGP